MTRACLICENPIITKVVSLKSISHMKYCVTCRAAIWIEYHQIQKLNWTQAIEVLKAKRAEAQQMAEQATDEIIQAIGRRQGEA